MDWNKICPPGADGSHIDVVCVAVCVSHLEHQSTHAEDHAEQVHVVGRGVLQCGVGLCAGGLVSTTPQMKSNQTHNERSISQLWTNNNNKISFTVPLRT